MREFTQAGVELVGADAPEGTAEVIEVLRAALDAAGLTRAVIGLGDADLYRQLLDELGAADDEARHGSSSASPTHDLVGLEAEVDELGLGAGERETLLRLPNLRGGREVLDEAHGLGGEAVERATGRLAATFDALGERGVADRVSLDLGLLRDLGYYTGAILEVYDPALGHVLGGGGRYDELMGRFGRPLPAAGFALYLERVHIAQAEEERLAAGEEPAREPAGRLRRHAARAPTGRCGWPCRAAPCSRGRSTCSTRSASTPPSCARRLALAGVRGGRARAGHDAALRRPDLRRGGRGRTLGITGKDVLLEQRDRARLRARSTSATGAAGWCSPAAGATSAWASRSAASARCGSRPSTRASPSATSRRPAARPR